MIDHITFGITDFARSTAFYDSAFAPLGIKRLFDVPPEHSGGVSLTGYGDVRPWFWIAEADATRGKLHVAILAPDRGAVDAFYYQALAAGGRDNGAPGLRLHYGPDYYGAFVLDPDGHNLGEGSGSFLKKRTKKLLLTWLSPSGEAEAETDKSFLLLFFKKEGISFAFRFGTLKRQVILLKKNFFFSVDKAAMTP